MLTDFENKPKDATNASAQDNTAPLWKRLLAALIDLFITSTCAQFFVDLTMAEQFEAEMIKYSFMPPPEVAEKFIAFQIQSLFLLMIVFFALNVFLLYQRGQTIGKVVMKLAIRDLENNKPTLAHLIVTRYLVQVPMLLLSFPSILDFIFILARKDRRSIHDLIAKTKVVDLNIKVASSTPTFMA